MDMDGDVEMKMTDVRANPVAGDAGLQHLDEEKAAKRINLSISPNDDAWRRALRFFQHLLAVPNKTIGQILVENFTQHEARMFIPSERGDIRNIQLANTERYYALLDGRFKFAKRGFATKLAMMYFGLPVEPMITPIDELYSDMEIREPEGPRYDVDPPLHFLTAHNRRNWGKDSMRGREACNYPMPFDPQQQIRPTMRGGAAGHDDLYDDDVDYLPHGEDVVTDKDTVFYLYGFQGCIPFVPSKWNSYARAVRQLLSIQFTDDSSYLYSLVHFDQSTNQVLATTDDALPLTNDSAAMGYLQQHLASAADHKSCCAFFVMLKDEHVPHTWEPLKQQLETDVARITWAPEGASAIKGRLNYAYLPFPKRLGTDKFRARRYGANQYLARLRAAVEVLVGRPEDSFHRAIFSFYDTNVEGLRKREVYGALHQPPSVLNKMHPLNNPIGAWTFKMSQTEPDEIALVLPNWTPPEGICTFLNKEDYGDAEDICRTMMENAFFGEVREKMDSIVLLPGSTALGRNVDRKMRAYRIAIDESLEYPNQASLPEVLNMFIVNDQEPFVVVHPVWKVDRSFLWAGWDPTPGKAQKHTSLPRLKSTVADIRRVVRLLVAASKRDPPYVPERDYLVLRQKRKDAVNPYPFIPTFVVTPHTTDAEWFGIRLGLVCRHVTVDIVQRKQIDWQAQIPKSVVWGPRYHFKPDPFQSPPQTEPAVSEVVVSEHAVPEPVDPKPADPEPAVPEPVIPEPVVPEEASVPMETEPTGDIMSTMEEIFNSGFFTSNTTRQGEDDVQQPTVQKQQVESIGAMLGMPPEAQNERDRTWATQPSMFDERILYPSCIRPPQIPINAPPAEHVFRTTSSVPMYSQAILTPSEQHDLQRAFWDLRNVVLARVNPCPYTDCTFVCRLDEKDKMEDHVRSTHQVDMCMWCGEAMPPWWTQEKKQRHIMTKHRAELKAALGQPVSTAQEHPDRAPIHVRRAGNLDRHESKEPGFFCDRCGRDRRDFSTIYEQDYHDRNCVHNLRGWWHEFCTSCGDRVWSSEEVAAEAGFENEYPHECEGDEDDQWHCKGCGIDTRPLSKRQREHHTKTCRAFGTRTATFCNWCGTEFGTGWTVGALAENMQHMRRCYRGLKSPKKHFKSPWKRLASSFKDGKIPLKELWPHDDSPVPDILHNLLVDPPRVLSFPLVEWYDLPGPKQVEDPGARCPDPSCENRDVPEMDEARLYEHFQTEHPNFTNHCPYCQADFRYKDGADAQKTMRPLNEIHLHLAAHIYCLWDRLSVGEDTLATDAPDDGDQASGTTRRNIQTFHSAVECPLFSDCGQTINRMTRQQLVDHFRTLHKEELLVEDRAMIRFYTREIMDELREQYEAMTPEDGSEMDMDSTDYNGDSDTDQPPDGGDDTALSEAALTRVISKIIGKLKFRIRSARAPPPQAEGQTTGETTGEQTAWTNIFGHLQPDAPEEGSNPAPGSEVQPPQGGDDAIEEQGVEEEQEEYFDPQPQTTKMAEKAKRKRKPKSKEAPKKKRKTSPVVVSEDDSVEVESEAVDDGSGEEPESASYRRRSPSPDWVEELGAAEDEFEPEEDMYCSKCLRKAPKKRDRSPRRSPLGRQVEMEFHTDPERSCGIRRGRGSGKGLPNRSGWITTKDMPTRIGRIKELFIKKFPAYQKTIYPTNKRDYNTSLWSSDPNNEENSDYWNIPWPPYEGEPPFPGWDRELEEDDRGTPTRKKSPYMPKPTADPPYRYQSDEDSADELKPDVDDLAGDVAAEAKKKRKRKKKVASKTPGGGQTSTADESSSDDGDGDNDAEAANQAAKKKKKANPKAKTKGKPAAKPPIGRPATRAQSTSVSNAGSSPKPSASKGKTQKK